MKLASVIASITQRPKSAATPREGLDVDDRGSVSLKALRADDRSLATPLSAYPFANVTSGDRGC
jgi:hypothetical protein